MPLNLLDSLIANGTKVNQPHVQQPPISRFFCTVFWIIWTQFCCKPTIPSSGSTSQIGFSTWENGVVSSRVPGATIKIRSHSSFSYVMVEKPQAFEWLPPLLVSHRHSFRFSFMKIWYWHRLHFLRLWRFIQKRCGISCSEIIVILMNSSIK